MLPPGERRILALDGGGIKGAFITSFLSTLEDTLHDRIANYFDLIAGTSTGGIIAIGLGLGLNASQLHEFYVAAGPKVFGGNKYVRLFRQIGWAKYNKSHLREAVQKSFGDSRLGHSKTRLFIPCTQLDSGKVYIYKTAHHSSLERDFKESAVDVAMATTAAPTFFGTHNSATGIPLIDGGFWANNPTCFAVGEAIGLLGWAANSISVLSIGTPQDPLNTARAWFGGLGLAYWAPRAMQLSMTAQSSASKGLARSLIGNERVKRIAPPVQSGLYKLDGYKAIRALGALGDAEARRELPLLREMFFDKGHAEKFQPFLTL